MMHVTVKGLKYRVLTLCKSLQECDFLGPWLLSDFWESERP